VDNSGRQSECEEKEDTTIAGEIEIMKIFHSILCTFGKNPAK
jgi:hypothetical protein